MKRIVAVLASCMILCSGVLSGCKSGKTETETSKQSETVTQTTTEKVTTTTSESEEETIGTEAIFKDLDKAWFEKLEAHYLKQYPERDHGGYLMVDGIRGYGLYGFSETDYAGPVIDFSYFSISFPVVSGVLKICFGTFGTFALFRQIFIGPFSSQHRSNLDPFSSQLR